MRHKRYKEVSIGPITYDGAVELHSLPEHLRRALCSFAQHSLHFRLGRPDARRLVSVILLYQTTTTPQTEVGVTEASPPSVALDAGRFGTNWLVTLERVRDLPRPSTHDRIGRLTIASPREGWFRTVGLTLPRFICAEAMVKKCQEALRSGKADLGPENVLCDMAQYEWAFQEFGERHQNALRGLYDASFEDVFAKQIRDCLFRLKNLLKQEGVDAILGGAFPAGYYWDTDPANVAYLDSVRRGTGEGTR